MLGLLLLGLCAALVMCAYELGYSDGYASGHDDGRHQLEEGRL